MQFILYDTIHDAAKEISDQTIYNWKRMAENDIMTLDAETQIQEYLGNQNNK